MATAKAKPRKPRPQALTVRLREYARGTSPHRVDRDKGVIYHVKVVGLSSPNTHGVKGVDGTEYTPESLRTAAPLYEGIKVNVDHPPRTRPEQERSSEDRIGKLVNVRAEDDGLYADLQLLKEHPLTPRLIEAAELMPDCYALSHNATGKGEVRGGKYVVVSIPEVHSVDIVADGGTNRSLFEGRTEMKTWTLRKRIKESKTLTPATRKRLLEMGARCAEEAMDREYDEDSGRPAMEEEDEKGEGQTWRHHVTNAVGSLVQSEDPEDHDTAGKLLKHLRPKEVEEEEEPADDPDPKDPEDLEDESQAGRSEGPEKKKGEENTASDEHGKENMESRQRRARARCRLAGIEPSADLLESLCHVPSARWDGILLTISTARGKGGPRSMAAGGVPVREGREVKDLKGWSEQLLRD